jgi:hypothetical protein
LPLARGAPAADAPTPAAAPCQLARLELAPLAPRREEAGADGAATPAAALLTRPFLSPLLAPRTAAPCDFFDPLGFCHGPVDLASALLSPQSHDPHAHLFLFPDENEAPLQLDAACALLRRASAQLQTPHAAANAGVRRLSFLEFGSLLGGNAQ